MSGKPESEWEKWACEWSWRRQWVLYVILRTVFFSSGTEMKCCSLLDYEFTWGWCIFLAIWTPTLSLFLRPCHNETLRFSVDESYDWVSSSSMCPGETWCLAIDESYDQSLVTCLLVREKDAPLTITKGWGQSCGLELNCPSIDMIET